MSTMGFEVHVDKENATYFPGINKTGSLKSFGPRDAKGKVQPTPRKALLDVNHESGSRNFAKNKLGSGSADAKDCFSALKSSLKTSGVENANVGAHNKKDQKRISEQKKETPILKELHAPKHKTSEKQQKPKSQPKKDLEDFGEEYDSDSIFPRHERLSTYADKLLTWTFPCFLGPPKDSESDNSDMEEECLLDNYVLDMPPFVPMVPEFSEADLDILIQEIPPPNPYCEDQESNAL